MHEETRNVETLLRIAERISEVYHLPRDAALSALKASAFYPLLVDPQRNYLEEGAEKKLSTLSERSGIRSVESKRRWRDCRVRQSRLVV